MNVPSTLGDLRDNHAIASAIEQELAARARRGESVDAELARATDFRVTFEEWIDGCERVQREGWALRAGLGWAPREPVGDD